MENSRTISRMRRRRRIRAQVKGTTEIPRLSVHKSLKHLRAQLIDDTTKRTLVALSTVGWKSPVNLAAAKKLGLSLAEKASGAGIKKVVFDRGGYPYHGQIKAVAEGAREGGLVF